MEECIFFYRFAKSRISKKWNKAIFSAIHRCFVRDIQSRSRYSSEINQCFKSRRYDYSLYLLCSFFEFERVFFFLLLLSHHNGNDIKERCDRRVAHKTLSIDRCDRNTFSAGSLKYPYSSLLFTVSIIKNDCNCIFICNFICETIDFVCAMNTKRVCKNTACVFPFS